MKSPYAPYDVQAKRRTPSFDAVTRDVIDRRVRAWPERRFFSPAEYRLLEAVCARLIPQPDRRQPIPLAPFVDALLHEDGGDGFRQPGVPVQQQLWRRGLADIEQTAMARCGGGFAGLDAADQDRTLAVVQDDEEPVEAFGGQSHRWFFEQVLLKTVAGIYYSHPDAWSEIGFGGPASPRGYVRMGLDERDPWEAPLARPSTGEP